MIRHNKQKGFTLVEMLVAVSIFTVISLMVTTVFLSMAQGQRRAQSTKTIIDNLNFAMDAMVLDLKGGLQYQILEDGVVGTGSNDEGDGIEFQAGRQDRGGLIKYQFKNNEDVPNYIERTRHGDEVELTDSESINIEDLTFTLIEKDQDEKGRQLVRISMKGEAMNKFNETISFNIQTSVSKRRMQ